jgi:predicted flap endonuclease-1-like 5' DNA nuclease
MSSFGCCFIWFLFGALLGWLLNYWLCKRCCNKTKETINHYTPPPAPAANQEATPTATAAPAMKAAAPAPAPTTEKPKTTPRKKVVAKSKPKTSPIPEKNIVIDLTAAKAAGISIKSADDLTVIEGIGPKINELFKENGLQSFAQVAAATVPQMRAILDKGGARFRIANPSTWAKQAKLAANNKWKELKKLQDDLSGGVKK